LEVQGEYSGIKIGINLNGFVQAGGNRSKPLNGFRQAGGNRIILCYHVINLGVVYLAKSGREEERAGRVLVDQAKQAGRGG